MSNSSLKKSWYNWALYNLSAWYLSFIFSIILSYTVVNIFHPEETNMLLGFGAGLCIGFVQWLLLKKKSDIQIFWIVAHALGIGIPYALGILILEGDIEVATTLDQKIILFITCISSGVLCGILTLKQFKHLSSSPVTAAAIYSLIWAVSLVSMFWGGLLFVAASSLFFYRILKTKEQ